MPHNVATARVFIAEDSTQIRDRVASMLASAGMSVVGHAQTAQSAIDRILATLPDVVVLDVQLESGSGLQVLQAVRKSAPSIAFVVFSNNAGPAYRKRYLQEGAARFLDKSIEFSSLPQAVADAFAQAIDRQPPLSKEMK